MIEKTLNRDKERAIAKALRSLKMDAYLTDVDFDKGEAYFDRWTEDEGYSDYMVKFTMSEDNLSATITSEPVKVTAQTEYVTISKSQEDSIANKILKGITSAFGGTNKDAPSVETVPVIKQFDEEKMEAVEPLYIAPEETDGHGWTASAEVLREMTESCNKAIQEGRLLSKYNHSEITDDFYFVKAWVNECDCYIGEHYVPEGQPMIKSQFTNKDAWDKRKSGELCGVSIGCKGIWENIEEQ